MNNIHKCCYYSEASEIIKNKRLRVGLYSGIVFVILEEKSVKARSFSQRFLPSV